MSEHTLTIPQLIAVLLITFSALRWYFSSPSSSSDTSSTSASRGLSRHDRVNPAHVEQLAQMFPQLDRREIAWELQRSRGNMAATTERVLSGRGLETVSFFSFFFPLLFWLLHYEDTDFVSLISFYFLLLRVLPMVSNHESVTSSEI